MSPLAALLLVMGGCALLVLLFWPVRGWMWRWMAAARASEKVRTEDALKHLYDCEYRGHPCSLQSLAGSLGLRADRAADLVARLEAADLVVPSEGSWQLTPEGRSYALRVIRIHRLWERYLSDVTGLDASEWHIQAERREHHTTPEQAEELAARTGHPRFDPHGDPIPTEEGEIAPLMGSPLSEIPVGRFGEIIHIEDEPDAVYAQLVAEGLNRGMRVRVLESTPSRVRFEADAEEIVLAPVVAANLSVVLMAEEEAAEERFERLSGLEPGDEARVVGISKACRGPDRRRMLDLGIIPGTRVAAEMRSPGGDPTAYRIRGAVVALRREQADMVHVTREEPEVAA